MPRDAWTVAEIGVLCFVLGFAWLGLFGAIVELIKREKDE